MHIPQCTYHAPKSLKTIFSLLKSFGTGASFLAGGTDLLVRMKQRLILPEHLIAIRGIKGIENIRYDRSKGLYVAAGVKLATLVTDPVVQENYPVLSYAASLVATTQIRNMATAGGNILQNTRCMYYNRSYQWGKAVSACFKRNGHLCHAVEKSRKCFAVYQGDLAPVLSVLGGVVTLASPETTKEVNVEELFTGDGAMPFQYTTPWLLTGIRIPPPSKNLFSAYKKYRLRNGMDFPLAGVAIALKLDGEIIKNFRMCLTGVASSPLLIQGSDTGIHDKNITLPLIREVADIAYRQAHPVNNLEGDASRRRTMIRLMVEDMLREAIPGYRGQGRGERKETI